MMYQRSNIGATLNKKRKIGLAKKIGAYFVFILFFICLANLGLATETARIKKVVVSGNNSIATQEIMKFVDKEMKRNYTWMTPSDNIILLRRTEIKNDILDNIKKINSVKIHTSNIDAIEIVVTERESKNLWCKDILSKNTCYFMDSDGFIFEEALNISDSTFPKFLGLIKDDFIGQNYLRNNFKNVAGLYSAIQRMSFQPQYFVAVDEHEYEVHIIGGGKILINDKKDFESSLLNLQALVDNKYIKTDIVSLKKIKYIDLRFGNKVNFQLI